MTGRGRRPTTTADGIARVALQLFEERGFEAVTIDDVSQAAGIGRRTFFRYFDSKNDIPWGDFDAQLVRMVDRLKAEDPGTEVMAAIRTAILDFNTFPASELIWLRRRMALILGTPALQAHATLRYAAWRQVIADFVGSRLGVPAADRVPQAVAHACLGVAVSSYEQWLSDPFGDLLAELTIGLDLLSGLPLGSSQSVILRSSG
jgi:mycofactocin system transcriptional regulator